KFQLMAPIISRIVKLMDWKAQYLMTLPVSYCANGKKGGFDYVIDYQRWVSGESYNVEKVRTHAGFVAGSPRLIFKNVPVTPRVDFPFNPLTKMFIETGNLPTLTLVWTENPHSTPYYTYMFLGGKYVKFTDN